MKKWDQAMYDEKGLHITRLYLERAGMVGLLIGNLKELRAALRSRMIRQAAKRFSCECTEHRKEWGENDWEIHVPDCLAIQSAYIDATSDGLTSR